MYSEKLEKYLKEMLIMIMRIILVVLVAGIIVATIQRSFHKSVDANPQKVSIVSQSVK